MWGYWGWGWWFFGSIVFLLIIWLIASAAGSRGRNIPPEEQILRERYARGEISIEEYRQRMRDLRRAA